MSYVDRGKATKDERDHPVRDTFAEIGIDMAGEAASGFLDGCSPVLLIGLLVPAMLAAIF